MAKVPPSQKFKLQPQVKKTEEEKVVLSSEVTKETADITPPIKTPKGDYKAVKMNIERTQSSHIRESQEKCSSHNG